MASLISLRPWAVVLLGFLYVFSVSGKTFEEDLTLTANEKKTFDKFRDLVLNQVELPHEYMKHDVYLIRWLRAQHFDIFEAKRMLEMDLRWRKEMKMDSINTEDWSYFKKNFPYSMEGRDKEGKPILYVDIGSMDLRREVVGGRTNEIVRYAAKIFEDSRTLIRELGEKQGNVSQGILILNVKGFSLVQHGCLQCVPGLLNFVATYENHYPGMGDKVFFINVPAAAQPILQAIRGLLHPDTNRVLAVYGTNRNVWLNALTKHISLNELPPELGGTKSYKDIDLDTLDY